MESSRERREGGDGAPDARRSITFGFGLGVIAGSAVFAITEDPVWVGVISMFGAAAGAAFATVVRTDRS